MAQVDFPNIKAKNGKQNKEVRGNIRFDGNVIISSSNENLSSTKKLKNLAYIKRLNMAKSKKSAKTLDFVKVRASNTDFLVSKAKTIFFSLWKAFVKVLIIYHFNPKCNILIKAHALGYIIDGILSQLVSDQNFFNYLTGKSLNFSKFKIGQWDIVIFFPRKMISAETW